MLKSKNLSFYFEGSPTAEVPKVIMQWGRSCYISMFPWKEFLMEWIRKIQKNKKERKKEIVAYTEVPILMCSPLIRNTLMQPSLRRTHSYGNLPYNKNNSIQDNQQQMILD
jgi:hypothetical protein